MTTVLILVSILSSLHGHTQVIPPPEVKNLWAKGIVGEGATRVTSSAIDIHGNLYLTGHFNGSTDFDPSSADGKIESIGQSDVFLAKYDASGNYQWAFGMGSAAYDEGNTVQVDRFGNVYLMGLFRLTMDADPGPETTLLTSSGGADIFFSKYSPEGRLEWVKQIGGPGMDAGRNMAIDGFGQLYLTGTFSGTTDFDPGIGNAFLTDNGYADIFLAKYSGQGDYLWANSIGGIDNDEGRCIATDINGNVYLSGYFSGNVDFNPGAGTANLSSLSLRDMFIARYDTDGQYQWAKPIAGIIASVFTQALKIDEDSNILITGLFRETADFDPSPATAELTSAGDEDIFLAKYNASGGHVWSKRIGGASSDNGLSLVVGRGGTFYVTGFYNETVDFDPGPGVANLSGPGSDDIFFARYDKDGNHVWSRSMGSPYLDQGTAIALDRGGKILLAGIFNDIVDFDPGPGSNTLDGGLNIFSGFIAAYSNSNSKIWNGGDGFWSVASNWNDGIVPEPYDEIAIMHGNPRLDVDFHVAEALFVGFLGTLTVQPGKTLSISGYADFDMQPIVFKSDASGTAQMGKITGKVISATNVTVERYIPNTGRRWRLLTAPVEGLSINAAWQNWQTWNGWGTLTSDGIGTLITGQQQGNAVTANGRGFDFWTGIANSSASVMSYTQRPGQGVWSPLANTTSANAFNSDPAYLLFVRGPRGSAYSTGTANAATTLRPIGALKIGDRNLWVDGTKGYTLIGNPYASQIDFDAVYMENGNSAVIKRQLWMWDATAGTSGNFQAVVYSGGRYVEVPAKFHAPGQSSPLTAIQSGHGFFVMPMTPSGGTLKIREWHKLSTPSPLPNILLNEDRTPRVWLNLVRRESDGTSLTADGVMAAYAENHRMQATDPEDAPKLENIHENLAIINEGTSLTADARPLSKMQEPIALRTWNLSAGAYRFESKVEHMSESGLKAFLEDRHTGTRTPLRMEGAITSIDVAMGQDAASRAEDRFRIVFEKAAVDASLTPEPDGDKGTMVIYPNPLSGRTLNVRLQNLPAGEYTLQLTAGDAKVVTSKKVRHEGGSTLHRIELNGVLPKGAYQLRCLGGNQPFGLEKLVVQ